MSSNLTLCCLALFCIATVYGYDKGHTTWGYKTEIHHPSDKHSKHPGYSSAYHISNFHHSPKHYEHKESNYDHKPHYEHKENHYEHKPHYEHKENHYEHKPHYEHKDVHYDHKPYFEPKSTYDYKPHYEQKSYYEQPKVIVKTVYKEVAPPAPKKVEEEEDEHSIKIDVETPLKNMFKKFGEENSENEEEPTNEFQGYGMYKQKQQPPAEEKSGKDFEIKIPKINIDKMMGNFGKGGGMDLKA